MALAAEEGDDDQSCRSVDGMDRVGADPARQKLLGAMAPAAVAIRDFCNVHEEGDETRVARESAHGAVDQVVNEILQENSRDPQPHLCELATAMRWLTLTNREGELDDIGHDLCPKLLNTLSRALIVAAGVDPMRYDPDTSPKRLVVSQPATAGLVS
jgi:hypothetical protein